METEKNETAVQDMTIDEIYGSMLADLPEPTPESEARIKEHEAYWRSQELPEEDKGIYGLLESVNDELEMLNFRMGLIYRLKEHMYECLKTHDLERAKAEYEKTHVRDVA